LVLLTIVAALFFKTYLNKNKSQSEKQTVGQTAGGPSKGQIGYSEPESKISAGTKELAKGKFIKVEEDKIFYDENGITVGQPLTTEVVISCTAQDLTLAEELDFDMVSRNHVSTPAQVGERVPAGEPVMILANLDKGQYRSHTVVMSESKCNF